MISLKDFFNPRNYPLIVLLVFLLALHAVYAYEFMIHPLYDFEIDGLYFSTCFSQLFILGKANFAIVRFNEWSSRILIEYVLVIMARFPVIWAVLDSVLITAAAWIVPKLLIPDFKSIDGGRKRIYYVVSAVLILLCIYANSVPFIRPGFIVGTLNYVWPFSLGLVNIYILREYLLKKRYLEAFERIAIYLLFIFSFVFAANMEIMAVVMFLVYAFMILYHLKDSSFNLMKVPKILYVLAILSGLFIIMHLTCPGNDVRFASETAGWISEYTSLTLFNKLDMAVTSVFYIMLTRFDFVVIYLLFAVIGVYTAIISQKKIISLISAYPFIVMSLIYLARLLDDKVNVMFIDIVTHAFRPAEIGAAFHGLLANGFTVPVLVIFLIYLTIFISLLLSVWFIFKYRNAGIALSVFIMLFLAFASQLVSGNAPSSIMVYPQYPGRYWIIFNEILTLPIALMIYDLLENWEFSIVKK